MTEAEIQVKINIAQREANYWREVLASRSCKNCSQCTHPGCGLADGAEPPPEVVQFGCDAWSWDGIPF